MAKKKTRIFVQLSDSGGMWEESEKRHRNNGEYIIELKGGTRP